MERPGRDPDHDPELLARAGGGQCVVYSQSRNIAMIPLSNGTFRRVTHDKLPSDALHRLSVDYVTGFMRIFGEAASGSRLDSRPTPPLESTPPTPLESTRPTPLESTRPSPPLESAPSVVEKSSTELKITPNAGVLPKKRRTGRPPKKKPSPDSSLINDEQKRKTESSFEQTSSEKSFSSSVTLPLRESVTLPLRESVTLPLRQSERTIRTKLLGNAVLDDDLGVGIDDDANQRRSWHKPRAYPVEILQHRYAGRGKLFFLLQKSSGIPQWLDSAAVEEQLQINYKTNVLHIDPRAEFPAPLKEPAKRKPRRKRETSSAGREGFFPHDWTLPGSPEL